MLLRDIVAMKENARTAHVARVTAAARELHARARARGRAAPAGLAYVYCASSVPGSPGSSRVLSGGAALMRSTRRCKLPPCANCEYYVLLQLSPS